MQSKSVTPASVLAGTDATATSITFRNVGPSTAQGVTLNDQFNPTPGDAGYTVTSITASQGTCCVQRGHRPDRLQYRQPHGRAGGNRHRGGAPEVDVVAAR